MGSTPPPSPPTPPDPPADPNPLADRRKKQAPYVDAGRQAIVQMLERYAAILWSEIVARAADRQWPGAPFRLDPHILITSLESLIPEQVSASSASTRGGRRITVLLPASQEGRKTEIERAAARKRLLAARYSSWSSGASDESTTQGVIGLAAERVVHDSLRQASPTVGYRLLNPDRGSIGRLFGVSVPGALDNAAMFVMPDEAARYLLAIEVTSLRQWIYPANQKVYQLLHKAAILTEALPEIEVLPVLVCRRGHLTVFRMARDLGFHVIDTNGIQWLPRLSTITDEAVKEIRAELGYDDLRFADGPNKYLHKQFSEVVPNVAKARSRRWRQVGSRFGDIYGSLRSRLSDNEVFAGHELNELRARAKQEIHNLPVEDRGSRDAGGW